MSDFVSMLNLSTNDVEDEGGIVTNIPSSSTDDPAHSLISQLLNLQSSGFSCPTASAVSGLADSPFPFPGNFSCKYYYVSNCNALIGRSHNFGIIQLNCRSIKNKFDDF